MKCLICNDGKDFTNFVAHLRTKHQLSEDEYNQRINSEIKVVEEGSVDETEESTSSGVTDPLKIRENIFDVPKEFTLETTLGEYLAKKGFKELKELNSLVDRYMKGQAIDVTYQLQKDKEIGEQGAESLKNQKHVETNRLMVAETLVKKYGFKVTVVKGEKPNKIWVLDKK